MIYSAFKVLGGATVMRALLLFLSLAVVAAKKAPKCWCRHGDQRPEQSAVAIVWYTRRMREIGLAWLI